MDKLRGILMLAAGSFAFYRGFLLHGRNAAFAFGLGFLAVALGVFRLTRKPPRPRL